MFMYILFTLMGLCIGFLLGVFSFKGLQKSYEDVLRADDELIELLKKHANARAYMTNTLIHYPSEDSTLVMELLSVVDVSLDILRDKVLYNPETKEIAFVYPNDETSAKENWT